MQLPERKSQSCAEAFGYATAGGQLARRLSKPDLPQLTSQISENWRSTALINCGGYGLEFSAVLIDPLHYVIRRGGKQLSFTICCLSASPLHLLWFFVVYKWGFPFYCGLIVTICPVLNSVPPPSHRIVFEILVSHGQTSILVWFVHFEPSPR